MTELFVARQQLIERFEFIPKAVVRFFDTGHFALETHAAEIAAAIREFLPK